MKNEKKTYRVVFEQAFRRCVTVEAANPEDAEELAAKAVGDIPRVEGWVKEDLDWVETAEVTDDGRVVNPYKLTFDL